MLDRLWKHRRRSYQRREANECTFFVLRRYTPMTTESFTIDTERFNRINTKLDGISLMMEFIISEARKIISNDQPDTVNKGVKEENNE
jgi:hypothetical protein